MSDQISFIEFRKFQRSLNAYKTDNAQEYIERGYQPGNEGYKPSIDI